MYELAQRVGSVFQNPKSQFFNLDTDSELAFGLENEAVRRKRSAAAWSRLRKHCVFRTCGEKTSFLYPAGKAASAFGSVYAMGPEIYVLDEPTANLDQEPLPASTTSSPL